MSRHPGAPSETNRRNLAPLLRIAQRDARRARGRSALIIAMIALPMFGMCLIGTLLRSYQLDDGEWLTRNLGRADAVYSLAGGGGGGIEQEPRGESWLGKGQPAEAKPVKPPLLADLPPAGSKTVTDAHGQARVRTSDGGLTSTQIRAVDWADPLVSGTVHPRSGRAARSATEAAISPGLAKRAGLHIGDTLTLDSPERSLRVVGIASSFGQARFSEILVTPGAMPDLVPDHLYAKTAAPVTWGTVKALNGREILVLSRDVVLHPPRRSDVPYLQTTSGSNDTVTAILAALLVGSMAALEIVLLAGAAFAVGARRQSRWLALICATGGRTSDVRTIVLGGGLVLGLTGALVGLVSGIAGAGVIMAVANAYGFSEAGHLDPRPELLAVIALGVATGLAAAFLPARTAARQDVVKVLAGRRPMPAVGKRVPIIALAITTIGIVLSVVGSTAALTRHDLTSRRVAEYTVVAGALLSQIGLVVLTPALLGWIGRLARYLPIAPRLAIRDISRQRGRTAPAVAAVLTAVTAASALLMVVAATDDHGRRTYLPQLPHEFASVGLTSYSFDPNTQQSAERLISPDRAMQAMTSIRKPSTSAVISDLRTAARCVNDMTHRCGSVNVERMPQDRCPTVNATQPTPGQIAAFERDARCLGVSFSSGTVPPMVIGDAATLSVLAPYAGAAAKAMLTAGGLVTFDPLGARDGKTTVQVYDAQTLAEGQAPDTPQPFHELTVPAIVVHAPKGTWSPQTVVSPALAAKLGFVGRPTALLMSFDPPLTSAQEDKTSAALRGADPELNLYVEHGYRSAYGIGLLVLVLGAGLVVLGSSAISTGLAQADARPDQATLAAVGAPPRVRRWLAAFQALTVAGIGTVLGILAGLVPALAYIKASESLNAVVPWQYMAELLIGVPTIAGAFAWLLVRSRLPLERRLG